MALMWIVLKLVTSIGRAADEERLSNDGLKGREESDAARKGIAGKRKPVLAWLWEMGDSNKPHKATFVPIMALKPLSSIYEYYSNHPTMAR